MPAESAADLATFFNEFASTATYALARGVASSISGIFDAGHARIDGLGMVPITSAEPTFIIQTSDLPSAAVQGAGDTLTVDGVKYSVVEIQTSGDGAVTTLVLSK